MRHRVLDGAANVGGYVADRRTSKSGWRVDVDRRGAVDGNGASSAATRRRRLTASRSAPEWVQSGARCPVTGEKQVNEKKQKAASLRGKAAAVGTAALAGAGSAMASGGGFDSSAITSAITTNVGIASGIIGAFILGVWTLRSLGLLKRS